MFSRRRMLQLGAAGLVLPSSLGISRKLRAADASSERKFLFVYCYGGWDTLQTFTPKFDNPYIDMQEGAELAEANGITFVDHANRPGVRTFFENYGDRACLINGIEVRSVTHERCQRLMFTGNGDSAVDDWAVVAASKTQATYAVPHLVITGPAFTAEYAANVVRAGEVGQLTELINGDALEKSTLPVNRPTALGDSWEDQLLAARIAAYNGSARRGSPARLGTLYADALTNLETLNAVGDSVDLNPDQSGCRRDISKDAACAFNAFEIGMTRCAMVKDMGWCSMSWDTHSNNDQYQSQSFEELFTYLNALMADLDGRTGLSGNPLRDEVTVVVLSEMARHPQLSGNGRAHWTYTSAMIIGSGVRGGQVIGEMNDDFEGEPIDLDSGEVSASGTGLLPGNLGATLLRLADVDPGDFTSSSPIEAALDL